MIISKILESWCFYFWDVLLYCDNELADTINWNNFLSNPYSCITKRSREIVTLLKKYVVKNSSSEKVAAIEGRIFWKSDRCEKAALQKKYVMRNITFLKNYLFLKCSFSEKVDSVQKYLLWKSSSFLDIFILNSFSEKK